MKTKNRIHPSARATTNQVASGVGVPKVDSVVGVRVNALRERVEVAERSLGWVKAMAVVLALLAAAVAGLVVTGRVQLVHARAVVLAPAAGAHGAALAAAQCAAEAPHAEHGAGLTHANAWAPEWAPAHADHALAAACIHPGAAHEGAWAAEQAWHPAPELAHAHAAAHQHALWQHAHAAWAA